MNGNHVDKGKGRARDDDDATGLLEDPNQRERETDETAEFLYDGNAARPAYGHRARTESVSSISIAFHALPIPLSRPVANPDELEQEVQHLNLTGGIALIVGLQIGSGIFSSPGLLTADSGSVGASLLLWLGAGLLAWTGASSFAELGAAIPQNGGAQAYLRYAYGPTVSYLYSWTAIVALKPGSAAIISIIFGEYMCRIFYHATVSAVSEETAQAIPILVIKLVATLAITAIAILNAVSLELGTKTQIALTLSKLLALLAVAVMGMVQLGLGNASDSLRGNIFEGSTSSPGRYALALYSGLWAYDGWDQCCYVAGEMKNVSRDLPLAIHISLPTVIVLFVVANISYFIVLPKSLVASSNTVGLDFGREMFGAIGGIVFALIVAISCFGALNSSFFTSSRLIFVAAKEGYLPKWFARLHATRKTPVNSIILQTLLTFIMIAFGNFSSLVSFFGIGSWLFYLLTVLGLLILRNREPNLKRPYRAWLVTPIVFCCVALFLLLMPIFSAPLEALAAFIFIVAGYPVYFFTRKAPTRYGIYGQEPQPQSKRELFIERLREIPRSVQAIFRRPEQDRTYEAVELDDT